MTSARETFLQTVRRAVMEGNRAGQVPSHPQRGAVGYQGAGPDPLARFCQELIAAGGQPHVVADRDAALAKVIELVKGCAATRVLLGRGRLLDALLLTEPLRAAGIEMATLDAGRPTLFQADVGISGVDYLIAETGSAVLFTASDQPRLLSLLPPVHIAVADRAQLLPDLFDLFELRQTREGQGVPACISIITGPSKTGDIELKLVTGVHGPGEIHVVLIAGPSPS